ncbi:glutamate carboxypeptidase [Jatrophihabitans endophyticus]|uniref:Glutamate carboxypeptidase n=1 Tax=Jatrophihabitans endophyticus TaxID=1206085 RepID=A0A1M5DST4_9ACTN|nr:M20/M25/M40 family metallo-hydrolase [Jatrophihabitans endophyticus]SHF69924.1 glutamate carboxypeptidase [Jatrophihabitans endophyticus]
MGVLPSPELVERFRAVTDAIVADIGTLVGCESPSADPAAVTRSADVVAEVGTAVLGAAPIRVERDGCAHLVWRLGNAATRVLLLGHHDTVWPLGTLERHPSTTHDGVLRGPGCFDMKAGLVMAFHAVAALPERDGVTILVTGDEEVGSPTSRGLIEDEARGARAVLVLEAAADDGALKTERKGVSLYTVRVHGRAAHAGLAPQDGANATVELAHQVLAITELADPVAGTTVTPTLLAAGTTTNTVPALGEVRVDVRVPSAAEQQRVDAAIRGLPARTPGTTVVVDGGPNRVPLEAGVSTALFDRAARLADALGSPPLRRVAVGGASDGNITAALGVPTLDGLGAAGGGAHADDEHVLVAELAPRTALLSALVADLLADPPTNPHTDPPTDPSAEPGVTGVPSAPTSATARTRGPRP